MKLHAVVFLAAAALSAAAIAAEPINKAEVEAIVKSAIAEHPEWVVDALKSYQEKQQAEDTAKARTALKEKGKDLREDPNSPTAGNPKGDVVMVEFFDYHCGYCKKMLPVITQLIKEDPKLKVVFKELPILSPDSETAARAALAVFKLAPGKYFDFHTLLMDSKNKFDDAALADAAKAVGVDAAKMKQEMDSDWVKEELKKNRELATALHIQGTPGFVIGDQLIPGASTVEEMKRRIAEARKSGEKK